jgi:hypothetical protein
MGVEIFGTELDFRTNYAMFDLSGDIKGVGRPDREGDNLVLKAGEFRYKLPLNKVSTIIEVDVISKHKNMNSAQDKHERSDYDGSSAQTMPWPTKTNTFGWVFFRYGETVINRGDIDEHKQSEAQDRILDVADKADLLQYDIRDLEVNLTEVARNANQAIGHRDDELHAVMAQMTTLIAALKAKQATLVKIMNAHVERIEGAV